MSPRVSVIICTHNRAPLLDRAIQSVRAQTLQDFELIVYDDGSTDDALDVARTHADADPRLRIIEAPHRGIARARAAANRLATAPLIGWLDSDDELAPACLAKTADYLDAHPGVAMVYTDHVIVDEHGSELGLGRRCAIPYSPDRMLVDFMTFHFRLFRATLYQAIGGVDESYPAAQDYDFCLRVSERASIAHLAVPLYRYHAHAGAISAARRHEQLASSARAVRAALDRRGLAKSIELRIDEATGRFGLVRKRPPRADPPDTPAQPTG